MSIVKIFVLTVVCLAAIVNAHGALDCPYGKRVGLAGSKASHVRLMISI